MKHYELLALVPGSLTEDGVQTSQQSIRALVEKHGARISKQEVWEKRKLAYPIRRARQGTYFLFLFDVEPATLGALERTLTLDRTIIRHQIVVAHQKTAKELERESRRAAHETQQATTPTEQPAGPALTGKELDEKLAEILTDDMVK